MYKFHIRRVRAVAGSMWNRNLSKIRQSFRNVYQKCNVQHQCSASYPTVTSHDSDEDDLSLDEEKKFTEILQDIHTSQDDLLNQTTDMVIMIARIQEKMDLYDTQIDILQTRMNANEDKQAIITKDILSLKANIDASKKKMTELENWSSRSNMCCLEIPEEEAKDKIIELFQKIVQPEAQKNTSISTDSKMSTANPAEVPIPASSHSLEENPTSPKGKTPKRSNPENASRNLQKARSNIYMYPDFRAWIKLFVRGGKWRVFLHATKLDECVPWLLSRPTKHPEESLTTPHREPLFGGFIENLTKIYLSVVNYFYCRFGFSEVEVTRL
ncbi:coiled-coil domain-containing protein 54-like [Perognathus longimembris pacificus]|uniref:coiled-coil domain-containing protein 54-like n=1 Tax=Perognathus longimembris pacificus TaxID=214514 RepID=UPI00201924D5|nr:coiled-coil domain-containing protein 54-like [Perognathus longimembris pacificus]